MSNRTSWGGTFIEPFPLSTFPHRPPPQPNPFHTKFADFFGLPFKADVSQEQLARAAIELLGSLPASNTSEDREKVTASINGMFERLDELQKQLLQAMRDQARQEMMREMKGSPDSILWVEPDAFDIGSYVLDEKVGTRIAELATQLERRHVYVERGIRAPTRLLFDGMPGTGKTMGAQWLAAKLKMPIAIVQAADLNSHFMAMTAKNISAVVKEAEKRGALLFLDEVDGLFMRRDGHTAGGVGEEFKRITTAFLQLMNTQPKDQVIVCATNLIDRLDPAMLRRFPTHVHFTPPDAAARRKIAEGVVGRMRVEVGAIELLVDRTDGASGDHVTNLAHEAARYAIDAGDDVAISIAHVRKALQAIPQPPTFQGATTSLAR